MGTLSAAALFPSQTAHGLKKRFSTLSFVALQPQDSVETWQKLSFVAETSFLSDPGPIIVYSLQDMQNMQNMQNMLKAQHTRPNIPNQTYETKPTKLNLPNQTYKPNLPNQTCQSKPTKTKLSQPSFLNQPTKLNPSNQIKITG